MFTDWVAGVMTRDLKALRREIEGYSDERDIWRTPPGVSNSAGNLALHLAGNIQHFIGMQMGGSAYTRNRDAEFQSRDLPRAQVLAQIDAAIADVQRTVPGLTDDQLEATYGIKLGDASVTTGDFLLHLSAHLTYHLGQIDYHRRVMTGEAGKIGAVLVSELSSARKPVNELTS